MHKTKSHNVRTVDSWYSSCTLFVQVPPGTVVRAKGAAEEDAPLAEMVHAGDRALLMTGGRGGRGNASFKSAFNK